MREKMARGKAKTSESVDNKSPKKSSKVAACALGQDECKRPDGKVSWLCCDGCEDWYHCNCVSVDPKVAADIIFHCATCKPIKEEVKLTFLFQIFHIFQQYH